MKSLIRTNSLFSLCGLNCGLCSMRLGGHCGGCGFGNQPCSMMRCASEHGAVEYCFQCDQYPCKRYDHVDDYDSFITHLRRRHDLEKARRIGTEIYNAEQTKKAEILNDLLNRYNDGRKKTLFCLAVNLLELEDLEKAVERADSETQTLPLKEKAAFIAALFQEAAAAKGLELRLRKKPRAASS